MTAPPNNPMVVLEPAIEDHNPALYQEVVGQSHVKGWVAVNDAQIDEYRQRGFLVIWTAFDTNQVQAIRNVLKRITGSDAPRCKIIAYGGTIIEHLREECQPQHHQFGQRTIGQSIDEIPRVNVELRSGYVRKVDDFCASHPGLRALATQAQLLNILHPIVGETIVLFQEIALVKPPMGAEIRGISTMPTSTIRWKPRAWVFGSRLTRLMSRTAAWSFLLAETSRVHVFILCGATTRCATATCNK